MNVSYKLLHRRLTAVAIVFLGCPCVSACVILQVCKHDILHAGISPNLKLRCSWVKRKTDYRSRSQGDLHIWSNEHFGRHFLTYLQNVQTYFDETCHNDTGDVFKVMNSNVKVTNNISPKHILAAEAYRSTVRRRRSFRLHCQFSGAWVDYFYLRKYHLHSVIFSCLC